MTGSGRRDVRWSVLRALLPSGADAFAAMLLTASTLAAATSREGAPLELAPRGRATSSRREGAPLELAPRGNVASRREGAPRRATSAARRDGVEAELAPSMRGVSMLGADGERGVAEGLGVVMALVRRLVVACGVPRGGAVVARAERAGSIAEALLIALGAAPTRARVAAMNAALVLCADHELNVSSFAVRVAASAGASLPACVLAGLAALSGPRHGGATRAVEELTLAIGAPEHAAAAIAEHRARGEAVPGFGHPLYPAGDPRGALLLDRAVKLAPRARGVRVLVAAASAMKLAEHEAPTVDVGLVALARALGLPRGAPLAIFACGRLAGWIAHALEQQREGHLLRPRARYVAQSASASTLRTVSAIGVAGA
ncbi:MAG: citrate synthase [Labilithrix sp.]|nr:citrate synthase [Labilithrix sp.]MCW5813836.1 citrate synthase [Labilithrix sp.]